MRWQFGGNLQPVRMICEFDWRECPTAVINYVWSEIVTDVVDCLTDDSMMWRVIAMLFVCTLLVHTIFSKARWMDETTVTRENLNVVGCKVQDLELKVNILTYKMQYGTWPLPRQIQPSGIDGGLRNVRLTLTNSSDRSTWLKHMLLSPTENAAYLPYAKTGPRSMRCLTKLINLETKYMSSRFSRDASPASNKVKSSRSSSERSIKFEQISRKSLDVSKTDERSIPSGENVKSCSKDSVKSSRRITKDSRSETQVLKYQEPDLFSTQRRSCENDLSVSKKRSTHVTKNQDINDHSGQRETSSQVPIRREYPRNAETVDKSPEERVNSTQGTLQQVTERLENLHSVLRTCGSPDRATSNHDQVCSNKELAESILQDLKNLGNLPVESESDGKTSGIVFQLFDSTADESQEAKEEEDEEEGAQDSASEFEQCQSNSKSSSARSHENSLDIQPEVFDEPAKKTLQDDEAAGRNVENSHTDPAQFDDEKHISPIISRDSSLEKASPVDKVPRVESSDEDAALRSVRPETEDELPQASLTESSQTELSKDSDADGKSNAALFREALQFKKALLTQIELEKEQEKLDDRPEQRSDDSESESSEPWPSVKSYFQSNLLDIISEEQSASSSTDKTSKSPAFSKPSIRTEDLQDETKHVKNSSAAGNNDNQKSKLALVSESSEYFSLSNLEEKMLAQNVVSSTAKDTQETSSDFTEDELLHETREDAEKSKKDDLQKNINDLVNQSVQNIREYIEVFSKMQNDAIVETKMAIIDENFNDPADPPKNCSSDDSIMHFVNTVALVDSMSEELPRELPVPAINSLVDLAAELSDEESPESWDYKPDFALKRRPGSISLAEQDSTEEKRRGEDRLSCDALDSRSIFESAFSEAEDDYPRTTDVHSSEPSCNDLVMDYLPDSNSDFAEDKFPDASINLIEFEEEARLRGKEDERRALDSPLTGRTVIRAIGSDSIGDWKAPSSNEGPGDNAVFEATGNSRDTGGDKNIRRGEIVDYTETADSEAVAEQSLAKVVESSSIYFNLELSSSEIKGGETSPGVVDESPECPSESNTWIAVDSETEKFKEERRQIEENFSVKENRAESSEDKQTGNCHDRPNSGDTVVIKNAQKDDEEIPSRANLSSDTSGTYMDAASSRDFSMNPSGTSLALDKSILHARSRIDVAGLSKSARGSSSSPLQLRIPWNAPKRGSSLNNATMSARSSKSGKTKSKQESPNRVAKTAASLQAKPMRSQSSGGNQLRAKSNFSLSDSKDLEYSTLTPGRRAAKSSVNLPERRSRSYATPRKNDATPKNSTTSQPADPPRISRARYDPDRTAVSPEKSAEAKKSRSTKKEERENLDQSRKLNSSEKSKKSMITSSAGGSSRSCSAKTSSRSCIPVLRTRIRAKSPMRGPLTMSTSSWRDETFRASNTPVENIPAEGNIAGGEEMAVVVQSTEPREIFEKNDALSSEKMPDRTVIYVNIVTEQEHSTTRVVDPKKFLEYLKDRELKVQRVFDQEIGAANSLASTAAPGSCSSPRVLTVVSSAVGSEVSSDRLPQRSNNSWSLRVQQREIEVSAKPSVIDTSTSISDLPDVTPETRGNLGKFEIFEVPKELTKDEYIVLLEALNQDPNLHQLREMHKLCNKLGLGFHE